jgi:hypothetical protein
MDQILFCGKVLSPVEKTIVSAASIDTRYGRRINLIFSDSTRIIITMNTALLFAAALREPVINNWCGKKIELSSVPWDTDALKRQWRVRTID